MEDDFQRWFVDRLTELRLQKGVSARDMSLSLGQNKNYINNIENYRSLPSMQMFHEICAYFHITPLQFYDPPCTDLSLTGKIQRLPVEHREVIDYLIDHLK